MIIARVLIIYDLVSVSYPPVFLIPRSVRYYRESLAAGQKRVRRDGEREFEPTV